MEHYYEFAGIRFRVIGSEQEIYSEHGVLMPFLTQSDDCDAYTLSISLTDDLTSPSGICIYEDPGKQIYHSDNSVIRFAGNPGRHHMRISRQGRSSQIECLRSAYPAGITPKTVLNAMEAEHRIVQHHGVILHASFIRVGEKAILFTAPSGTGKSTQAALWCRYRDAELINGDRAALMFHHGRVFACGIPFAGSSGVSKAAKLPLAAIVYLSQAKENVAEVLSGLTSFRKVWEGCSVNIWDKEDLSLASDTVLKVLKNVPVFHLACRPDQDAVDTLYSALTDSIVLRKICK